MDWHEWTSMASVPGHYVCPLCGGYTTRLSRSPIHYEVIGATVYNDAWSERCDGCLWSVAMRPPFAVPLRTLQPHAVHILRDDGWHVISKAGT